MQQKISKSQFKPKVLEYLRQVQKKKRPLTITHAGKPVVQIVPYSEDPKAVLQSLRSTVVSYKDPTKPLAKDDWEALK